MGNYIAHKRRKIRRQSPENSASKAARSDAVDSELTLRRQRERGELDRARAAKMMRALKRQIERRVTPVDRISGRQRTAARVAGVVIISALAGLRTLTVSIRRMPNNAPSELWDADIKFQNEHEFAYCFNDPTIPAETDAMHLMRYAAPRIAEEMLMGSATAGADDGNKQTVLQLAESYISKLHMHPSLSDDYKRELAVRIINDFEETTASRLRHFHAEFFGLVDVLMRRTRPSRRECKYILDGIYASLEAFQIQKTQRMRAKASHANGVRDSL